MRLVCLALALLLSTAPLAQEAKKKPQKKQAAKTQQAAHKKPTPEQIRKFNELEKKQK